MPRVSEKTAGKQKAKIVKLAGRKTGVTLPEIIDALGISRPYAAKLVSEIGLPIREKDGQANVYGLPESKIGRAEIQDRIALVDGSGAVERKSPSGRKIELDDEEPTAPKGKAKPSEPVTPTDLRNLEIEVAKLSATLSLKQAKLSAIYSNRHK